MHRRVQVRRGQVGLGRALHVRRVRCRIELVDRVLLGLRNRVERFLQIRCRRVELVDAFANLADQARVVVLRGFLRLTRLPP